MSDRRALHALLAIALLSASLAAQRHRISIPLADGGHVDRYAITPDGSRVVYSAAQALDAPRALYARGLPDGVNKLLDPGLDPGPVPLDFEITSDGARAVFARASQLCSVRTDGSEPTVVLADDVSFVFVSPDSQHVLFLTSGGLWSVPIDGSAAPFLLHAHPSIHWFIEFTPDGSHVLYIATGMSADSGRLYSARVDGSTPPVALFNGTGETRVGDYRSTPDGLRVVFQNAYPRGAFWSAPIDGGVAATRLDSAGTTGFVDFTPSLAPRFTPDSAWVVYEVVESPTRRVLQAVPTLGGVAPIQLNAPLVAGGSVVFFQLTPDGSEVVYTADQDVDEVYELHAVPSQGGVPRKLNRPGEEVFAFDPSPDGSHVAYIGESGGIKQVCVASLAPGGGVDTRSGVPAAQLLWGFPDGHAFDPSGRWIVYSALSFELGSWRMRLYTVESTGVPHPRRLDTAAVLGSSVMPGAGDSLYAPAMHFADGPLAVYRADLEHRGVFELWASPLEKSRVTRH